MNIQLDISSKMRALLMACLLTFLQMACTYTPVYDSNGRPQVSSPGASEQTNLPNPENEAAEESQTDTPQQPVRVAVVSPDAIKHKPTVSNKDVAAARLRSRHMNPAE